MKKFAFGTLVILAFIGVCSVMASGIQIIHVTSGYCDGKECDWENCPLSNKIQNRWIWAWMKGDDKLVKEAFDPPKTVK